MTPLVHTISMETTLPQARDAMQKWKVRHLPVLDGTRLVGLLSDRELARLEGFPMIDFNLVSTADAMADDPYAVSPDAPLLEVIDKMREHRYGSAIVADGDLILGIFTTTDALNVLSTMLTRG